MSADKFSLNKQGERINRMPVAKYLAILLVKSLTGHSGQKNFWWVFSQKNSTDLKTNFVNFELSTTYVPKI